MSNTFDKLSVLDSFIEEVNSYLPEIEANLNHLRIVQQSSPELSNGDMVALEETYRRTHTIGGSASMMDFPGLAHVAHGMEDILGDVLDGIATLDLATIDLLHRSLGRMHRLLDGIRTGIDEDAIIAEDDADYDQYRTAIESSAESPESPESVGSPAETSPQEDESTQITDARLRTTTDEALSTSTSNSPQSPSESSLPSLDEMVASFHAPTTDVGEEVAWPEEPAPQIEVYAPPQQEEVQEEPQTPSEPLLPAAQQPSALEVLAATTQSTSTRVTPPPMVNDQVAAIDDNTAITTSRTDIAPSSALFSRVYNDMQEDTQNLETQASSLQRTLTQLRLAVSVIEAQRTEFRGFLDGSKDALDRMEDWAGKAMGLNLRNSPEQVRRYLPLSVMWVANSKLKKVLDLLVMMTSNVEMTDDQIRTNLQHLRSSLEACGVAFGQWQSGSSPLLPTEPGWTSWAMQVSPIRDRVTFERQGDPVAMRAEIEAKLREELRREYEERPQTLAARTELERQIRKEILRELENNRQLQESLAGSARTETVQEIESRLRTQIEIEVRREFLSQLTGEVEEEAEEPESVSPGQSAAFLASTSPVLPPPPQLAVPVVSTYSSSAPSIGSEFAEEAAELFRLEAEEHLKAISTNLAGLENAPDDRDLIQGIRRPIHTLKGAAGMMGFRTIADLCHISEDLLDSVMEGAIAISPNVLSLILDTTEALDVLISGKESEQHNDEAIQSLRVRYVELLGEHHTPAGEEELDTEIEEANDVAIIEAPSVSGVVTAAQAAEASVQRSAGANLSVRVSLQKLDELVNLFGELLVNRSILEERIQRLMRLVADASVSSARLRDVGQKLESRFEAATLPSGRSVQVMPGQGSQNLALPANSNGKHTNGPSHLADFDELELDRYTEFHQLARGLSEGISDMTTLSNEMETAIRECEGVFGRENRLSTTFQDRLMKARLVPLSTMIPRLYRTARAVALKQQKDFNFVVEGQETEVDRTVIEEIAGPLLHLMRNAVNHAIETPEIRLEKGKSPAGQIKLSAAYEGNQVVITVRDDGTGIDPERIRQSAISRGLIRPDQVLSDNEIIDLIFRPGFSTAAVLSEESGRGVGLDVVRDSVSRLRGMLEVEFMPGQGTAFTMKFPTSLAIQSAMMVQVKDQQFALPTVMVEAIGRLDNFKRSMFGGQPAIIVQNETYPITLLAHLLGTPVGIVDEKAPLLLVNTGGQRVALLVDVVKGKMDVVMKNLGPHLRQVRGIAGGTVLGNGRVVLILELIELLSAARSRAKAESASIPMPAHLENLAIPPQQSAAPARTNVEVSTTLADRRSMIISAPPVTAAESEHGKYVLVVDDSPSVRRVVSNMLKQHGWEVQVARDGGEALEMVTREVPAAVLLDIEMPRMDGYELIATIRAQEQYRQLPLVVLTSRAASKHQQRAIQLGANAYVVKPYQDEELINLLNTLVYGTTVR